MANVLREKQHKGPEKATALDSAWLLAELELPRRLREPPPLFAINLCTVGGGDSSKRAPKRRPKQPKKLKNKLAGGKATGAGVRKETKNY